MEMTTSEMASTDSLTVEVDITGQDSEVNHVVNHKDSLLKIMTTNEEDIRMNKEEYREDLHQKTITYRKFLSNGNCITDKIQEKNIEGDLESNLSKKDQDLCKSSLDNDNERTTEEINLTEKSNSQTEEHKQKTKNGDIHDNKEELVKKSMFTIAQDEDIYDDSSSEMIHLLRGTICELERALRDSRELIKTRDEEIARLRRELVKGREQIHKEQVKFLKKSKMLEENALEIQELSTKLQKSEKDREELLERIKELESPPDDTVSCCSSMEEVLQLKMELMEKNDFIKEIKKNNHPEILDNAIVSATNWKRKEQDQHYHLKLKFLRDAFFYFMIDFHSEEQMKAILAVLAYGDQREDVIQQAFNMRQRGKKFTVKEVSSRGLAFLHEET